MLKVTIEIVLSHNMSSIYDEFGRFVVESRDGVMFSVHKNDLNDYKGGSEFLFPVKKITNGIETITFECNHSRGM